MYKNEKPSLLTFYAISPIHAGCGSSMGVVDLPIQRERHTNWPHIQSSAVKGALRSHFRDFCGNDIELINLIFGTDSDNDGKRDHGTKDDNIPGSISISDAKLFAFPVRSNISPFIWLTCPALLRRIAEDFKFAGLEIFREDKLDDLANDIKNDSAIWLRGLPQNADKNILLEDAVVEADNAKSEKIDELSEYFKKIDKLLCISDEMFKYVVDNFTEIQTQIKIDSKTGTAQDGALRYQELLASDTALYSIIYFIPTNGIENELKTENMRNIIESGIKDYIQIGGDETLGRGICKIKWHRGGV